MVPRNIYIIKYVARVYYYINSVFYILYIPTYTIIPNTTPFLLLVKRSDRSASDGSGAWTAADGSESSTRAAESSGMVEKVVFEQGDTLTHIENIPII